MEEAPNGLLLLPDSRYREEAARTVREAAVDGFIVYSTPQNDPRRGGLGRRLPVVTVDQPRGAETPFVGIDDRAGARSAAEHLARARAQARRSALVHHLARPGAASWSSI